MPLHLDDLDVVSEAAGLRSALIVPCNMCPAITVAVREEEPFIQLFKSLLKSAPFDRHVRALQSRLAEQQVDATVFHSHLPYQWFLCMWTAARREKLRRAASHYDAVIVLGCDSAAATVRDAVEQTDVQVIEGMEVIGFLNAKMHLRLPFDVFFEDCTMVPMSNNNRDKGTSA